MSRARQQDEPPGQPLTEASLAQLNGSLNTHANAPPPSSRASVQGADDDVHSDIDGSSTTSLGSITETMFRSEFGRRYAAGEGYLVPVDDCSVRRMGYIHRLFMQADQGFVTRAPVDNAHERILDVGTGFGDWATSFGDAFPTAMVKGVDICPIQNPWVPPNVSFEIYDVEQHPWTFRDGFDLIHFQDMDGCFADMKTVMASAFNKLKPGGWIELKDLPLLPHCDYESIVGTPMQDLSESLFLAASLLGRPFRVLDYGGMLEQIGFRDITSRSRRVPSNAIWPLALYERAIGHEFFRHVGGSLESICLARLVHGLGWTEDQVKVACKQALEHLGDSRCTIYFEIHIVVARRPFDACDVNLDSIKPSASKSD